MWSRQEGWCTAMSRLIRSPTPSKQMDYDVQTLNSLLKGYGGASHTVFVPSNHSNPDDSKHNTYLNVFPNECGDENAVQGREL